MAKRKRPHNGGRGYEKRIRLTPTQLAVLKKAADVELKFHDIDVDDAVIATGFSVQTALLTIPEGNGEEERIGRSITIKKINWRFRVTLPTTAVADETADTARVVLVWDKQANGAAPASTDVFETNDFQSFNNLSNNRRFRILMDKTYSIRSQGGSGRGATDTLSYAENVIDDTCFKNVNIPIEYDNTATTGAITTIRSNNITVLLSSASGLVGFSSKMRFRYTDR